MRPTLARGGRLVRDDPGRPLCSPEDPVNRRHSKLRHEQPELSARHEVTPDDRRQAGAEPIVPPVLYWLVALAIGSSFYVVIEPAPTDLFFLLLFAAVLGKKGIRFPLDLNPILAIGLLGFAAGSTLSLLWSRDFGHAALFFSITTYMLVSWYLVVTLLQNYGPPTWELIRRAFLVAAALAAIIGLVSHFSSVLQNVLALRDVEGLRTRSAFKDPNVYAPFLCAALLLVINQIITRRLLSITSLSLLCLFAVELLAAFSRGAFVNFAVSLSVYFGLLVCFSPRRDWLSRSFMIALVGSILVVVASIVFLKTARLEDFLFTRLQLQSYDTERFSTQALAIATLAEAPFGIGPGQSDVWFPVAPHNVYIRIMAENGLLTGLCWLLFLSVIVWIGMRGARRPGPFQDVYICTLAILAGIMVNSLVIDSLHWRHFFLFLAIPIGLARYERWRARAAISIAGVATRS
jgi:O-antigen ligase